MLTYLFNKLLFILGWRLEYVASVKQERAMLKILKNVGT